MIKSDITGRKQPATTNGINEICCSQWISDTLLTVRVILHWVSLNQPHPQTLNVEVSIIFLPCFEDPKPSVIWSVSKRLWKFIRPGSSKTNLWQRACMRVPRVRGLRVCFSAFSHLRFSYTASLYSEFYNWRVICMEIADLHRRAFCRWLSCNDRNSWPSMELRMFRTSLLTAGNCVHSLRSRHNKHDPFYH